MHPHSASRVKSVPDNQQLTERNPLPFILLSDLLTSSFKLNPAVIFTGKGFYNSARFLF